ncbi:phage tail protein [Enterobacter sp. RIT418]|uniref:phage tail protein n=1 Tax=Enterobacter sp. RIT418 TaxID=2202164 RepID=UPI000D4925A8|nr:phage tail protein [Enterobacter sp. RIT 418]RAU35924.1 phage tail protein [Enterobacter sp. RIT 418]
MSQLESLTAFITANLPRDAMQMFSSSMDDCELVRSAKAMGNNQRRIGVLTYSARLSWDNFPFRKYSPGLIYALVLAWVDEHANELRDELKLADPTVDPEFDDEGTCILDVVVGLADPVIIREVAGGPIPFRDKSWDIVNPEIWVAEEAEIIVQTGDAS